MQGVSITTSAMPGIQKLLGPWSAPDYSASYLITCKYPEQNQVVSYGITVISILRAGFTTSRQLFKLRLGTNPPD
jgi:hypothetical protein